MERGIRLCQVEKSKVKGKNKKEEEETKKEQKREVKEPTEVVSGYQKNRR